MCVCIYIKPHIIIYIPYTLYMCIYMYIYVSYKYVLLYIIIYYIYFIDFDVIQTYV